MSDVYVYFAEEFNRTKSAHQREVADGIILDYDTVGRLLGAEIIGAARITIDGKFTDE